MRWALRIPEPLLATIRVDLRRPHAFAFERVGFLFVRSVEVDTTMPIGLALRYEPVPDDQYLEDSSVGARIAGEAIRHAMQAALTGVREGIGVLHVHAHPHTGTPRFSGVDRRDIPRIAASMRAVSPQSLHGALLLSDDALAGFLWCPGDPAPTERGKITIVGRPLRFESGGGLYA